MSEERDIDAELTEAIASLRQSGIGGMAGMMARAVDEIRRLREIVDRLPVTSDGVPIAPGMILYGAPNAYPFKIHAVDDHELDYTWSLGKALEHCPKLYSTESAALSASPAGEGAGKAGEP